MRARLEPEAPRREGRDAPREPRPHALTVLQQGAGNQAVTRLVRGRRSVARLVQDSRPHHPTLRQGSGPASEVRTLQTRLNEDGATPALAVDGSFGPLTKAATAGFQGRHGLTDDGVVGLRTWGLLDELATRGIAGPERTVADQVQPVDQAKHDEIEAILHPGGGGGKPGPDMTGTGPGGEYETQMLAALDALAVQRLASLVDKPAVDMNHANRVADAGQREVEAFYGSAITLASRKPTGEWHPGSSRMGLADASTRPVDDAEILGWMEYFMSVKGRPPATVGETHHYDNSRPTPDRAEHDRVRDLWLTTHDGRDKATKMIRGWPAEASTGTVFLQLRSKNYQDRVGMWDLFGTMVHEFLHLVTHPNYGDAADAIGGVARNILIEGMDDHFAQQVWPGVLGRAGADATLRATIEGPFFEAAVDVADYGSGGDIAKRMAGHHYPAMAEADQIASKAGEANARAAFFMGHAEALGLGAGSAGEHGLDGLASWSAAGGGVPGEYPVAAGGATLAEVQDRTGATAVQDSDGAPVTDPARRFAEGVKLRVPGLGWHTAIKEDTRGQVATQHGLAQERLEHANGLAPDTPTAPLAAGTLLMVPVR